MRLFLSMILIVAIASGLGWQESLAQTVGGEYFEATGHYVAGEFLAFYHRVPNPLELYGNPITEAFPDTTTGKPIQYFEKARFELHPEAPSDQRVQLSPLGEYLYVAGQSLPFPDNACRAVPPGGFQICYDFLTFFDKNGGEAQFGPPISNAEIQNRVIVQYFQRASFEFHPDLPPGRRIVLADLGLQYFTVRGEDPSLRDPVADGGIVNGIVSLKARAFLSKAVTSMEGKQTVYVIVKDQRRMPVADAIVTLAVRMPSGEESSYIVPVPTNAQGVTQYTFSFSSSQVGVAEVRVTATYENLKTQTITSFRIWW